MTTPIIALILVALGLLFGLLASEDKSDRHYFLAMAAIPAVVWVVALIWVAS